MLTRPKNIVPHPVGGTLGLKTIDCPFPDEPGGRYSVGQIQSQGAFSVWIHGGALNGEARAPGMGVNTHLPRDHPISSPADPSFLLLLAIEYVQRRARSD